MDYKKIWLQIETDPESEWCDEVIVTWCQDQIDEDDVEYVIATKYAELEAENEQLKIIINDILAERVKELEADNERLQRVAKVAGDVFNTASRTQENPMVYCPHGISPQYPAHGWWCDDCFFELEAALKELKGE